MTRFAIASFVPAGSAVAMLDSAHGQGVQHQCTPRRQSGRCHHRRHRAIRQSPTWRRRYQLQGSRTWRLTASRRQWARRIPDRHVPFIRPTAVRFSSRLPGRDVRRPRFELRTRRRVGRTGPRPVKRIHGSVCELTTDRMSTHNSSPNMGELQRPNTYVEAPIERVENLRFLRGRGCYLDHNSHPATVLRWHRGGR